jgi:hypothetical protein
MTKRIKKLSRKREEKIAQETGGRRHSGSGSQWYRKSDASDPDFQYEDKFTESDKYSVSISDLHKIEKEAQGVRKLPVFRFGFLSKNASHDYAVLREKDCVYNDSLCHVYTSKKSITLEGLELKAMSSGLKASVFLLLVFENKEAFVVLRWDDFLDVKKKIMKGEKI